MITKDNVTIRVEAAVFYRVVDPVKAVVAIRDYRHAILRIAQTTLRATLGRHELDDVLANQAAINEQLKEIIDTATEPWGIQVVAVETKDVDLPDTMKRAMARQAEAERERRAKIIAAEGEFQAAERLVAGGRRHRAGERAPSPCERFRHSPRSRPSTTPPWCCRFRWTCRDAP